MIRRRLVRNKVDLAPLDWKFYLALATAVVMTIWFYCFVIGFREWYRHIMVHDYPVFVSLSPSRHFLYDLFFAFTSTTVGFMVFTKMWLPSNLAVSPFIRSRILVDQQYVPGTFIHLFFKIGMMFGLVLAGTGMFNYLDIGAEVWLLFVIAPIFLFLHQWMTLRLRVKQATIKVMLLAGAGQLVFAAGLAIIPVHDFSKLDALSIKYSIPHVLRLNLPRFGGPELISRPWSSAIMHVGFRKDNGEIAISFGDFKSDFITLDELLSDRFPAAQVEFYNRNNSIFNSVVVNLYADRDVPAATIINIMKRLKEKGDVEYNLIANDVKERKGLPMKVDGYCNEVFSGHNFSNRLVTQFGDTIFPYIVPPCPTVDYNKDYEVFRLSFKNNRVVLDDTLRTKGQLYEWTYRRMANQHDSTGMKTFMVPVVDDSTSYETYFDAYEEVWRALIDGMPRSEKQAEDDDRPVSVPFQRDLKPNEMAHVFLFERFVWKVIGPYEEHIYDDLFAQLEKIQKH